MEELLLRGVVLCLVLRGRRIVRHDGGTGSEELGERMKTDKESETLRCEVRDAGDALARSRLADATI